MRQSAHQRTTRKAHERFLKEGPNVVVLDRDVAREFPDSASVNRALRSVLKDKPKRNIGQEILEGIREIKRGKHGRVVVRRAAARIKGCARRPGSEIGL